VTVRQPPRATGPDDEAAELPNRAVTIKDVARVAGVHPSTVSRSLDPTQATISSETRERVLKAARELGYRPDILASGFRSNRSRTIGVVIPDFGNPIYGQLLRGITLQLDRDGYVPLTVESRDETDRLEETLETLAARRVEGIITGATRERDVRTLRRFARRGIPLVMAVRWVRALEVPRVTNDDLRGGTIAAEHLLDLGHVRLAQVHGPSDTETFRERCQGFRRAAAAAGVFLDEPAEHATEPTVAEGRRLMSGLLDSAVDLPTAVFAHSDAMAIGAIEALTERGLRCPDDVSVIGYNDMPLVEHLDPPLSTVRMPTGEVGRVAAQTLLAAVAGHLDPVASIALQPTLVARGSTAPLNTEAAAGAPSPTIRSVHG
jgi:LacI family transcriptional regulator